MMKRKQFNVVLVKIDEFGQDEWEQIGLEEEYSEMMRCQKEEIQLEVSIITGHDYCTVLLPNNQIVDGLSLYHIKILN